MRFWRTRNLAALGPIEEEEMRLVVGQRASETVVSVTGRVTMESSPHLRSLLLRLLQKRRSTAIEIDIAGVTCVDTSGIATLLEALKLAQSQSVRLHLVGVGGQPRILAEVTELATVFAAAGSEVVFR